MHLIYAYLDAPTRAHLLTLDIDQAPPAYRQRLRRKQHPDARAQTQAGLWLLRTALARADLSPRLDALIIDARNRPVFPRGPVFSISHTNDWAACAVLTPDDAAQAIGLDIQAHRTMPGARMARLCHADERAAIAANPALFFDYWCAREATVKATGQVGLKRIRQVRLQPNSAWLDGQRWQLHWLSLAPAVSTCVVSDAQLSALDVAGPLSPLFSRQ